MDYFSVKYLIWAIALGGISAASLPLGSILGIRYNFRPMFISILAAFGAGALIAALAVELVAPTVLELSDVAELGQENAKQKLCFLIMGAILGGLLYILLDQLVNAKGGFLRKSVAVIQHFGTAEKKRKKLLVETLSTFSIFQNLSPEHVNTLLSMIRPILFNDEETIAKQGDDLDKLLFIIKGQIEVKRDGKEVGTFGPGSILGLASVFTNIPSPGSGKARGVVRGLYLSQSDFHELRQLSPEFNKTSREMAVERLTILEELVSSQTQQALDWKTKAVEALQVGMQLPSADQFRRAKDEYEGAPLAIWLGILIDGIPESFVIGSGLLVVLQAKANILGTLSFVDIVPFTLIAGLFLSNFPEALSSSSNMKKQGWGKQRIFWMWFSLMVVTAIGSGFGFSLADSLNHTWLIFAEGLAAGAMLTMIAAAMIPEAVHTGNANVVGLSTLIGFVAAISFKLLE